MIYMGHPKGFERDYVFIIDVHEENDVLSEQPFHSIILLDEIETSRVQLEFHQNILMIMCFLMDKGHYSAFSGSDLRSVQRA